MSTDLRDLTMAVPASIRERIAEHQAQIDALNSDRNIAIARALETIAGGFGNLLARVAMWTTHSCLYITLDRVDDAADVLRAVRSAGYALRERVDDQQNIAIRWQFEDGICVFAILTGAVCAFRKVGTKEVPVYEVQCGEAAADAQGVAS